MRVRERAWIEHCTRTGVYYVKTNGGAISYHSNYEDARDHANFINNEDADCPHWIDVPDPRCEETEEERREKEERFELSRQLAYERNKRLDEKRAKEQKKVENNRKSKRSDEKYVYVISLIERGARNLTEYLKGETNLLKFKDFTVCEAKDAKVFLTKASAQKMVDMLSGNRLITKVYRNLKVVQKKREIFKN